MPAGLLGDITETIEQRLPHQLRVLLDPAGLGADERIGRLAVATSLPVTTSNAMTLVEAVPISMLE